MKKLYLALALILGFALFPNPPVHAGDFHDINTLQPDDTTVTGDFFNTGFDSTNIYFTIIDTISDTGLWIIDINGLVKLSPGQRLYIGLSNDDTVSAPNIDTIIHRAELWGSGDVYQRISFSAEVRDYESQTNLIDTLYVFLSTGSTSRSVAISEIRIESRIFGVNGG